MEPIREHCCTGKTINFDRCNANSHSFGPAGAPVDFCLVFSREDLFKSDVNKRGLYVGGPQNLNFCQS